MTKRDRVQWPILFFILLLVGGIIGGLLFWDYRNAEQREGEHLQVQAWVIDDNLARQIVGINDALISVRDAMPRWRRGDDFLVRVTRRLKTMSEAIPSVRLMGIVDEKGHVVVAHLAQWSDSNHSRAEVFKMPPAKLNPAVLYVSPPYEDARGATSVMLARTILNASGQFGGFVYAKLDLDYLDVITRSVLYAPDMLASIMSYDGQMVMQAGGGQHLMPSDMTYPESAFSRHLANDQTSSLETDRSSSGRPARLVALRNIEPARVWMSQPLMVVVSRELRAIYRPWRERLILVGLCFLGGSTMGIWHLRVRRRRRDAQIRIADEREQERREYIERFELALGGADLGLWDRNFVTNVKTYNERWCAMIGYERAEIDSNGVSWQTLVHPDDLPAASAALGRHVAGEDPLYESEHRMRHKDGYWIWIQARGKVVARDAAGMPVRMVGTHMDISERKRAEAVLRESEARFRSLTALTADWYWELDEQFRFVRLDGGVIGMRDAKSGVILGSQAPSGRSRIGLTRWEVGALNMTPADWEAHRAVLEAHQTFHDLELLSIDSLGRKYWMSINGEPIFDESGDFRGYRGVGRNITERKKAERKIERLAFFDELTGLPNRRLLTDRLQKALAASVRNGSRGALLFIDLDNFKDLNDTQGHDVGDLLLQQVATRLRQCVREVDTVARLGGDEFIVMLDELSHDEAQAAAQAEQVGRKILEALNQHFELLGQHHHSTPSIGITLFHDQLQSVDELLKRADLAMYQSKAAGRNTLRFFDPAMQAAASARAALEADLRQGLQREELLLYYQPVVDANSRITGVEALVRWQHPQRGLVSPLEFIPMAEQTGLIFPLGEWVLKTACLQLVSWSRQPATGQLSVAVNVSARQFRQPEFAGQVQALLRQTGANPFRLKLELTESLLLSDVEDAIDKMSQLRAIGVSFSLDDFGTGYSSLSYLKRLPLDQLKIDQSFVRDVLSDPNDAAIVRTILALARSMELTVVAEGVETQGQREFLARNGCEVFQGYLFGRPGPIEALDGMTLAPVAETSG